MAVPFKNRLQRYHKESLNTLFRTLEFKRGVERYSSGSSGSTPLTTSVTLTGAELIAAGAPSGQVIKQLLPAAGAGKYYRIIQCTAKFKDATVAFDTAQSAGLRTSTGENYIGGSSSVLPPSGTTDEKNIGYFVGICPKVNGDLTFSYISSFGSAPTVGDGNIIFEIEYEILDF